MGAERVLHSSLSVPPYEGGVFGYVIGYGLEGHDDGLLGLTVFCGSVALQKLAFTTTR